MAFNVAKPADDDYVSASPADIRENFRALKEDKIVDAGKLEGLTAAQLGGAKSAVFSADGTFTVPAGVTSALVVCIGGGGGGGGAGNGTTYAGTAGHPGEVTITKVTSLVPAEVLDVIAGTGGAAGSNGGAGADGTNGTSGENSSLKRGATVLAEARGGTLGYAAKLSANAANALVDVLRIPRLAIGGMWWDVDPYIAHGAGGAAGGPAVTISTVGGSNFNILDTPEAGRDGLVVIIY